MPDLDTIRSTLARIPNPIAVLESLFALAPVGFQIYEAAGRSILVNQAFLDLFGSEPPPGYNVLEDEIAAKNGVLEIIHRAFRGETVQTPPIWYDPRELTRVKVQEGRKVAIAATFFPLRDRHDAVTHVAIVFRDMTAELAQRDELERERELLAAIIDQVSEGIVMADPEGRLRLVNRAARDMGVRPGTPFEEWRDLYGVRGTDGKPIDPRDTPLGRALQGETASAVIQHQVPGGAVRSLSSVAVPLRAANGSSRGAVVTFRDETDRVLREREAQQTAHFRERFMGILGHDLRTPLTAILASAGLLLRDQGAETVRTSAGRIERSARRMRRMISDLLDFTDVRLGGELPLQRRPCDLREVAQVVADEISAANPERVIALDVSGDVSGSFDPDRAAQLLSNLLENALTHGPRDDRVRIRLAGQPAAVEMVVENGGPAIPARERDLLFDPFRRGRPVQTSRGLGLGLFIVQQIARAHGGDVEVESSNGRTVFRALFQR